MKQTLPSWGQKYGGEADVGMPSRMRISSATPAFTEDVLPLHVPTDKTGRMAWNQMLWRNYILSEKEGYEGWDLVSQTWMFGATWDALGCPGYSPRRFVLIFVISGQIASKPWGIWSGCRHACLQNWTPPCIYVCVSLCHCSSQTVSAKIPNFWFGIQTVVVVVS